MPHQDSAVLSSKRSTTKRRVAPDHVPFQMRTISARNVQIVNSIRMIVLIIRVNADMDGDLRSIPENKLGWHSLREMK